MSAQYPFIKHIKTQNLALEKERSKYQTLFDSSPDAVLLFRGIEIIDCNPTAVYLFSNGEKSIIGKTVFDLSPDLQNTGITSEELAPVYLRKCEEQGLITYEWRHIKKSGIVFDAEVRLRYLTKEQDTPVFVSFVRDITRIKQTQEQLHQSRKMEAVGQLAGGIAHDFNNMLGGILGAAELLNNTCGNNPKNQRYLKMIENAAGRAANLTSKLLSFSRRQTISIAPVTIHTPLKDAIDLIKGTMDRRINVKTELYQKETTVLGDQSQLQSAFLNIMINAVQAMPEGGELRIKSRMTELDETYCKKSPFDLQPGAFAEIEIRDTGCGIPAEKMQHIFEPFFTTKKQGQGTGLGLASVFGTVQQHKGAISVCSEAGNGTAFHIFLPLALTTADSKSTTKSGKALSGTGTVLIVDDEEIMRTTGAEMLNSLGYDILFAENGRQALDVFKQNITRIDVVLLDMIMPEMNGRECFMELKRIKPDISVILSSGFSKDEEVETMKANGLRCFIRKPYRIVEMSQAIHDAIE